ncbi:hypothetical protein G6F16_008363 [Rhizopus arrhizus]|nr:hypothetical protein G6F23_005684 [Rhizopus arrhizus]KAG0758761.1 hypothetical protein G6F24_009563 [Rhizopus arrhizus]KAG0784885.1 hypothetical protein G6F21_009620 [Rhizopus arrhizus]KAG0793407.1 hypothetical protein G6F22_005615 [Rhizopus arrhizus]KAG0810533.1 hypothetical protein G6F20_007886 [Rhizopus arrhizus]
MSNNSNQQNIDTLTHPSVYRDTINCQRRKSDTTDVNMKTQNETKQNQDWDLYPQLIRKIENEGSEEQVKRLHQLELEKSNQ